MTAHNTAPLAALIASHPEECAAVRKRAVSGAGVYTGNTLEYWKKKAQA